MKLMHFQQQQDYRFTLYFANGEVKTADLEPLIGAHVAPDSLVSARIDPEWGCLEFRGGEVDIAPQTLYRFAA